MYSTNEHSKQILKKYVDQVLIDSSKISFFILSGPNGIGKTEIVQNLAKEILGDYFLQDFLYVQDFSKELGKTHNLKIEQKDDNDVSKLLLKDFGYVDIGVREINSWLSLSSVGKTKIVLLENIDRMTDGACNAFLKTCEEPLPNRIIISTTSNKSKVLTTVLSRSIIIPFYEYHYDDLIKICDDKNLFQDNKLLKEFVCFICMGKPNLLCYFDDVFKKNDGLVDQFSKLIPILNGDNIADKYNALLAINKAGFFDQVLDGIIAYYVQNGNFILAQKWLEIKKMSQSNVKVDNLLFYAVL